MGHREPDERVRRARSRSTTPTAASSSPPRSDRELDASRPAEHDGHRRVAGRRRRPRLHLAPAAATVRRPAALGPTWTAARHGGAALAARPVPLGRRPAAAAAAAADACATSSRSRSTSRACGAASTARPASRTPWYDAPTFYFTNPYAVIGAARRRRRSRRAARCSTSSSRSPRVDRPRRPRPRPRAGPRAHRRLHDPQRLVRARPAGREMKVGLGPAKGKDSATTLGPVAGHRRRARAVPRRRRLPRPGPDRVRSTAPWSARTCCRTWAGPFEELVAYASRGTEVRPGDVLGSGTCGNGGCLGRAVGPRRGAQSPPPLQPGDVVDADRRGHRHHPQPRRPRRRARPGAARPAARPATPPRRCIRPGRRARSSSSPAPAQGQGAAEAAAARPRRARTVIGAT